MEVKKILACFLLCTTVKFSQCYSIHLKIPVFERDKNCVQKSNDLYTRYANLFMWIHKDYSPKFYETTTGQKHWIGINHGTAQTNHRDTTSQKPFLMGSNPQTTTKAEDEDDIQKEFQKILEDEYDAQMSRQTETPLTQSVISSSTTHENESDNNLQESAWTNWIDWWKNQSDIKTQVPFRNRKMTYMK